MGLPHVLFTMQVQVGNVMCGSCEYGVGEEVLAFFDKQREWLPRTAKIPSRGGVSPAVIRKAHFLTITILVDEADASYQIPETKLAELRQGFQDAVAKDNHAPPSAIDEQAARNLAKPGAVNWPNILVNLFAMGVILLLHFLCLPSILVTILCTSVSFLSTAFSARQYLINFFHMLRSRRFESMSVMVSSGWFLALLHTLYHSIQMPLAADASMMFMSFLMPILLIMTINCMDELKRWVVNKIDDMKVKGGKSLFSEMDKEYELIDCEVLGEIKDDDLRPLLWSDDGQRRDFSSFKKRGYLPKGALNRGMIIVISPGESVPVDCVLLQGSGFVDEAHFTGEHTRLVQPGEEIGATAINLSDANLIVWAKADAYGSHINNILVASHIPEERVSSDETPSRLQFSSIYSGLIIAGMLAAICIPLGLGVLTLPLVLKNLTSILFTVCPCTIAIAEKLSRTLLWYQLSRYGVVLRQESLLSPMDEIKTVVFDKTGTLTTGRCKVSRSKGINAYLWRRIYQLEKRFGREHPIAKAIEQHYESSKAFKRNILVEDLNAKMMEGSNSIERNMFDKTHELINLDSQGLHGRSEGQEIHIGNRAFLEKAGVENLPEEAMNQADTIIYVAQNKIYEGSIQIQHEVRPGVLNTLRQLRDAKKTIIMLTGDTTASAKAFNRGALSGVFEECNIHGDKTPIPKNGWKNQSKQEFIEKLPNHQRVWSVGDGVNDAVFSRYLTSKGGVSAAMNLDDKVSSFTDLSLNGHLDYLLLHHRLGRILRKNLLQNKALIFYGLIGFLSFILSFSALNIGLLPILPLLIMVSTTGMVLCNSYRIACVVDQCLGQGSQLGAFLASDASIGLLAGGNALFLSGLLMASIHAAQFTFPALLFTAGLSTAVSAACVLSGGILLGVVALLFVTNLLTNKPTPKVYADLDEQPNAYSALTTVSPSMVEEQQEPLFTGLFPSLGDIDVVVSSISLKG